MQSDCLLSLLLFPHQEPQQEAIQTAASLTAKSGPTKQISRHSLVGQALVGQAIRELVDENNCCDSYAKLDDKFANCVPVPGMAA